MTNIMLTGIEATLRSLKAGLVFRQAYHYKEDRVTGLCELLYWLNIRRILCAINSNSRPSIPVLTGVEG
jgi:hypothetical protein